MSTPAPASPSKTKKSYGARKTGKKGDEKRREEEKRQREEAAANESKERERMAVHDNDSRLFLLDLQRRQRNAERRMKETKEIAMMEGQRASQLGEFHTRLAKDEEWKQYITSASPSSSSSSSLITPRGSTIKTPKHRGVPIDATSEAEVNTWLTLWGDKNSNNLFDTLLDAQDAELIMRDMDRISSLAERKGDNELVTRLNKNRESLREMQTQQIDRATAHIIQHADEYANSKNEVLLAYDTGDIKYCMWINLSKNPRVKTIEFADLNISLDIPKSLALASVAIRLIHFRYDNLSVGHRSDYTSIGGILHLDLLALPPPPKKVKGWTLRQVTPLATSIARLPYPGQPSHLPPNSHSSDHSLHLPSAPSIASISSHQAAPLSMSRSSSLIPPTTTPMTSSAWAPISIAWPVPKDVIIGVTPQAGWWDDEAHVWRLDSISHEFNPESRRISIQTISPAPLALLYNYAQLYPLAAWELRPSSHERNIALLTLITRTGLEFQIHIGEGVCSLALPDNKELSHLHTQKLDPILLLKKLALSGIALNNKYALPPGMITAKNETLERETCKQISRMVQAFSFRQSPVNQNMDTNTCLFQVGTSKDDGASEYPDQLEDWHTCHITPIGCHLLEKEPEPGSELLMDEEVAERHTHLVHCLEPLRPHLRSVISSTSVALSECAENLLWSLGVFSFTS